MSKGKTYWAGYKNGKFDMRPAMNCMDIQYGWDFPLYATRKEAREDGYKDVRKVRIVEVRK